MKKTLIALAVATTGAVCALPALAQQHVSLYGIVDAGLVYNTNVGGTSRVGLDSGYLQSSRFGLRGSEDMGGGLRAVFTLENGFNIDQGTTSATVTDGRPVAFFNRQSWAGLSANTWGTLTLGRQYTPLYDALIMLAGAPAFGVSGGALDGVGAPGSTAGRFDNGLGGTRLDNSIKYASPTMNGLKVTGLASAAEAVNATATTRTLALAANYSKNALTLGGGVQNRICSALGGCALAPPNDRVVALGAGYDFGPAKLASTWTRQTNAKNVRGANADVLHVMVQVPTGNWLLAAGVQRLNDKSALDHNIRQTNLSAIYSLSKRTSAYGSYSSQKVANGGLASMAVTTSSTGSQSVLALGLRHTF